MGKQAEQKAIDAEKRANLLKETAQKFFSDLREICAKEQVNIVPIIKPVGAPGIEIVSLRPPFRRTIWSRLLFRPQPNGEVTRLKTLDAVIKGLLDNYQLIWYAVITPVGAQLQVDFKPDATLPSTLWVPPDAGRITTPQIEVPK